MKANINFKNAEEFQKLLERAATLSVQLQETLQQINDFDLAIEVKKAATAATAAINLNEKNVDQIVENLANCIQKELNNIND